ncbi:winged helix-turn-helix transcriptional regulator [Mesorhizobium sp. B2-4-7]|nr:winged helix-turn-helix transcriptional regulator [Mesorhizobium sp. B3-1-1]TPJ41028.1 winged helix-turn-helix transcriptional regulator [Mesorhizobium sp. B2-6-6]TPJ58983.1 winged helix-turn-helix transcriptional regulator [Mesorhizobium sp. B2-6-1]TPJ63260.1 winged helix-turn-helix transcriptional regulator [Mesorhizobium sp. B2-6-7]TPJ79658.1 winged helix-turn-helix transcriptional regulator [Mesorhizobium sp. B2-6-3]TPJ93902.1 winged helix-turn-helix transcriptional regulator [Mesorhizo
MQLIFEALSSPVRRKILAYVAHHELSAGDIAGRFDMSKPSISQHLQLLEHAGLVLSEKRGKFVYYRQAPNTLASTLTGFVQEICPVGRPIRRESKALARKAKAPGAKDQQVAKIPVAKASAAKSLAAKAKATASAPPKRARPRTNKVKERTA